MKIVTKLVLSVLFVMARGVSAQECSFTTEFEVTRLPGIVGIFGIAETEGLDINEAGEAVGSAFAETPALAWRGVRWPVGASKPEVLTDGMGRANGIAENAVVAGDDVLGASLWDADNEQTLLPRLPGQSASAQDINSNGIAVGYSMTATDIYPVAWPDGADGDPINLTEGVPDAFSGLMRKINPRGIAVGEMTFFEAPFERAVVWSAARRRVAILPGLIGFQGAEGAATAIGVNDRGLVVGQGYRPLRGGVAAILPVAWRRDGVHALPRGSFAGGTAFDVNNCGTIVGEGINNVFDIRAVIWQDGVIRELDDLHDGPPLGLTSAVAINNAGQILVNGGAQQTWILTPVPPVGDAAADPSLVSP